MGTGALENLIDLILNSDKKSSEDDDGSPDYGDQKTVKRVGQTHADLQQDQLLIKSNLVPRSDDKIRLYF